MDMLVKLYALPDSRPAYDRLQQAGIVMRRALAPEKHKVTAWVRETFSEAWASETEVAFSRQPVSCFIAIQQKAIMGFACYDAACRNFFGPTGVAPKSQQNGIGKALLVHLAKHCLANGWARLQWAVLDWNAPSIAFYKSL